MRSIQDWFEDYGHYHQHPANQAIHWVCVPVIMWCVIALLWLIPVPEGMLQQGAWAILALFVAFLFYHRLSRNLSWAMALVFIVMALITYGLFGLLGHSVLLWLAVALFVVAWVGHFIGHRLEGRRPAFFNDLRFTLIGPAWLASRIMHRFGIGW